MKKRSMIGSLLFAVLCILQMGIISYVCTAVPITSVPMWLFVELAVVFACGGAAVYLFAANTVSISAKKIIVCISLLYLISMGVFYTVQMDLFNTMFMTYGVDVSTNITPMIVLFVVKALLLAVAAYFAAAPSKETETVVVFETPKTPEELESPEAVEALIEQLDETEE